MFDFKSKVALITGGASGIGLAYAKELLRRESKVVALVDINHENGKSAVTQIRSEFKRDDCVIFIKADVSDKGQLQNAFDIVVNTYNQLDILINNAGIIQERNWEKCIAINFTAVITGTFLATETYFPKYKSGSESLIINTASKVAFYPAYPIPVYAATKSGIVEFTRSVGDFHRYEINNTKIIAICPGHVCTSLVNFLTEDHILEPYLSKTREVEETGQTPEEFARIALDVVGNAPTGSIWTVTTEGCNEIKFHF
ncbi:hypothetical protein ILUMI_09781 [Ignelater luminosus]|uniref:15-hydroxyprostaglandin dehydrogenase [NAD(+)]-like n=1 Tax=Ignelater luminosus TaxID=2038154 RepID=A0A8K0D557_IGNLU|nr:hypothetical protein ILUMI_09781 [Ignelater luminosus]